MSQTKSFFAVERLTLFDSISKILLPFKSFSECLIILYVMLTEFCFKNTILLKNVSLCFADLNKTLFEAGLATTKSRTLRFRLKVLSPQQEFGNSFGGV